ncbi:hypothetical protein Tsubulata_013047 [Turnera subulata]|uniref:Phytocyanin domain-containing protein n=1 Tax=Turnera subulata TaxID=218843 RepID=A0A9Q0G8G9_9ROSI|nr:hypothetical protein Tsubulata_013047 [Turnera subulata]
MARFMGVAFGLVVAVLLQCAAAQTVHIVGDGIGWRVPQNAQAYANWANGKSFVVGDTLQFNFITNEHDVLKVPKASYDACTQSNPVGSMITTGPANITLDTAGEHYYICTIGRHCQFGQKLAITVSSTPGAMPPTTPTTPTTTPVTPSPADSADCAPTPSPNPAAAGGPSGSRVPGTATPGSSSSSLLGSLFVSMLAISMGLFF